MQYHADTKTVTAAFKSGFVLDKDTVYAVNFEVKPAQKAYDEYADQSGVYPHIGSVGSDAPGNATSAEKNGFTPMSMKKCLLSIPMVQTVRHRRRIYIRKSRLCRYQIHRLQ